MCDEKMDVPGELFAACVQITEAFRGDEMIRRVGREGERAKVNHARVTR